MVCSSLMDCTPITDGSSSTYSPTRSSSTMSRHTSASTSCALSMSALLGTGTSMIARAQSCDWLTAVTI